MATETKIETKKRAINRLQTMYALRGLTDKQYEDAQKAAKEGKPIAWCMVEPFASPFLNAVGMESVYTESYSSVCAANNVLVTDYIDRALADGLPTTVCGYAQANVGYAARQSDLGGEIPPEAPRGGMPKPGLLIGQCGGTCDARYKWYQGLARYFDARLWIMETPGTRMQRESLMEGAYERDVKFMVGHLRDFVDFLERLLGKKFDYDKFEEDIDNTMKMDALWHKITDVMRRGRPCPMHARDHLSAMQSMLMRASDPAGVIDLLTKMRDEVQYRIDNGICAINYPEKYRATFTTLGPWNHMFIFDRLAERGWNFVRQGYHPQPPIDLSWVKDPIEKLVRYRQRSLEWTIDYNFKPEEATQVKKEILEQGYCAKLTTVDARDAQLDGVVLHVAITCRPTSTRTGLQQRQYMEGYKVPSMVLMGDMIDPRLVDVDDFFKRAEAFEETMDYYKEVRKKEGLPW